MQVGGGGAAGRDRVDRLEHGRGERAPGDGVAQLEGLGGAHLRPAHALGGPDGGQDALRRVAGAQGLQDDAPRGVASQGGQDGVERVHAGLGHQRGSWGRESCGRRPRPRKRASGSAPRGAGPCRSSPSAPATGGGGGGRVQRAMGRVDLPAPVEDGVQRALAVGARARALVPLAPHQAARPEEALDPRPVASRSRSRGARTGPGRPGSRPRRRAPCPRAGGRRRGGRYAHPRPARAAARPGGPGRRPRRPARVPAPDRPAGAGGGEAPCQAARRSGSTGPTSGGRPPGASR